MADSRAAQGFPPKVTDPSALAALHALQKSLRQTPCLGNQPTKGNQ